MASALLRVVRFGTQIGFCQITALARTSKVARILELTIRTCSVVPKFQRSDDVLRQRAPNSLENDGVQPINNVKLAGDNVELLLKPVSNKLLSCREATDILLALGKLAAGENRATEVNNILNDRKFAVLCSAIDENVTGLSGNTLIAVLRTLLGFGLSADDSVIESVETQILWKIRTMNLKHLIHLFVILVDHQLRNTKRANAGIYLGYNVIHCSLTCVAINGILQKTDLETQVFTEVLARLQQRWFEVSDIRDVITLLRHSSHFRSDFIHKLEDRVIDMVENGMSADDLHRVFVVLAEQRIRPTHLLRSITYHLAKHQQKLTLKHIANLTNAMSSLNYSDPTLLRRISDELLAEIPGAANPAIVAAILTAFGRIQWRHPALMAAFSEWILKNITRCRVVDLVAYVLTSARVQYGLTTVGDRDEEGDPTAVILNTILTRVTRESVNADAIWLNVIWSLAIFGRATLTQVQSVLDESFYRELINSSGYPSIAARRKILNLHAVAKWELGHNESLPSELASDQILELQQTKGDEELRKSVLDTLSNYVPKGKFLSCNKWTLGGIFVDGEFVLDKEGKPLPVEDYTTNFGEVPSSERLAPGAHRVALLVQDFKDFTSNSVGLTGPASLRIRILEKTGYKVVTIPYSDYNVKAATLKRLQYLQLTIKDAIGIGSKKSNT